MSAPTIYQEFDRQKGLLGNQSMANKTSKSTVTRIETELRQALIKSRGSPENDIMIKIHELAARDEPNDRIGRCFSESSGSSCYPGIQQNS